MFLQDKHIGGIRSYLEHTHFVLSCRVGHVVDLWFYYLTVSSLSSNLLTLRLLSLLTVHVEHDPRGATQVTS